MLWPRERQDLFIFGEKKVIDKVQHFQALFRKHDFDEQACLNEWLELKILVNKRPELRGQSVRNYWYHIFTAYCNEFVNILMVVELCLVILVQTACVKRRTSCLNRIMKDHRSSLGVPTMIALMHIAVHGLSDTEHDATRALEGWLTSGEKRRRPEYLGLQQNG